MANQNRNHPQGGEQDRQRQNQGQPNQPGQDRDKMNQPGGQPRPGKDIKDPGKDMGKGGITNDDDVEQPRELDDDERSTQRNPQQGNKPPMKP